VDSVLDSTRGALWAAARLALTPCFTLEPTARVERSSVNGHTFFAPRVSATWQLDAGTRARFALGVLGQSPGYEKVLQSQYFVELGWPAGHSSTPTEPPPTVPGDTPGPPTSPGSGSAGDLGGVVTALQGLDSERSIGGLLQLERPIGGGLTLRAEAFYRRLDHLIVGRLETDDERRARLARYDFPPELRDQMPSDPQITRFPVNAGQGRAYGLDLYVARTAGRLTGWAAYSYGLATRSTFGQSHPADFDCRHALSLVGNLTLKPTLRLGITSRLATGLPMTPGQERVEVTPDVADVDGDGNRTELIPRRKADGSLSIVGHQVPGDLALLNSERQSAYFRVDARITWNPGRGRWLLYLDVINLFNRQVEDYSMLPIIPSLGAHVRF
jgi:hypothetical protein